MGYFWPIERDVERLLQARSRISVLRLGRVPCQGIRLPSIESGLARAEIRCDFGK